MTLPQVTRAYHVQPNLSTGPAKGRIRSHEHVTLGQREHLAPRYLQEMVCRAPRAG